MPLISLVAYGPSDGILNENVPTVSSSDFAVPAHNFMLADRSAISALEWFTTTKRTCGFLLGSSVKRSPTVSTYFCKALALAFAPADEDAFCNAAGGPLVAASLDPEKYLMP